MEEVSAWLAAQHVPVQRVELACDQALPAGSGPEAQAQVMVLTDAVAQATVDSAVHALADHPAVAGPVVTLRVEWLEG
jgi:homoserine dehydrogenase